MVPDSKDAIDPGTVREKHPTDPTEPIEQPFEHPAVAFARTRTSKTEAVLEADFEDGATMAAFLRFVADEIQRTGKGRVKVIVERIGGGDKRGA